MNVFSKFFKKAIDPFLGLTSSSGFFSGGSPAKWSKRRQLEQFNRYVYTIVSAFSQDFAKTKYKMVQSLNKTGKEIDHELIDLLDNPNEQMSGFEFRELHAIYMKLAGESFWYIVRGSISGKPKELWLLRPDLVQVEISNDKIGTVKGYKYSVPGGKLTDFEPEEIIHHKYPNPTNPHRGLGVVEAAMIYIQTEEYTSEWTKSSIYNSGRPSGIINLKGKMVDTQFEQLKESFKQEYTGTQNAGKTLLLKGFDGIDWAKLGMDLEGIDLEKVKQISRDDILFMFRTSKTIMGITDDVNRANSQEMRGVWMENVVKPELDRFVDKINFALTTPVYGKQFKVTYVDPNPETIDDKVDEWTQGFNKWLTINDIIRERNQILGTEIGEKEGGNEIWQPLNLIPLEKASEQADEEPVEEKPPKEKPPEEEPEEEPKKEKKVVKTINKLKTLTKQERGEVLRKQLFAEQEQWEKPYQKRVNSVFNKQKAEILGRMKSVKEINKKNLNAWLFDTVTSSALWKEAILPIASEMLEQQAKFMFDFVDDESVSGTLEITSSLKASIEDRVARWASDADADTIDFIEDTITEGMKDGESISVLRGRIEDVYETATKVRSVRIARTETIWASNQASLAAMRQLPSIVGKEWLTQPDACEFCASLDGVILGLNTNFINQGEVVNGIDGGHYVADYESIEHPSLHPNCRCTILPVNVSEQRDVRLKELEKMLGSYNEMDKRTKEAKDTLKLMSDEKKELASQRKETEDILKQITELVDAIN